MRAAAAAARARLPIPRAHLRLALADDNVAENSGGAELGDADARDDHVDAVCLPPCEGTIRGCRQEMFARRCPARGGSKTV